MSMPPLDDAARRYVLRLVTLTRQATQMCSAKSEDWNKLNDEFNDWYRRQFPDRIIESTGKPIDPVHYLQQKKPNIQLTDAEAGWSHWEREVQRLSAALDVEYKARVMLAWGTDAE